MTIALLAERGYVLDDPFLTASHLAVRMRGRPLDRTMFCGDDSITAADLDRHER